MDTNTETTEGVNTMTPCEQASTIDAISHTLTRMEKTQDRLVELLEKVAKQDARLDHLEDHSEKAYNDISVAFDRLRDIELNQAAYGPAARDKFYELVTEMNTKMEDVNSRIEMFNSKLSTATRFYKSLTHKYALYFYGFLLALIAINTASNIFNHGDWLKSIWIFYRG